MSDRCEAVVIGTGFGGAINACRLARKWPGKVVALERGKRYGMGEFPRSPGDFTRNFWVLPDRTPHPGHVRRAARAAGKAGELHGMYDVRNYDHMDVVVCAGVGGGSLIYANVFLIPPDEVLADKRWPSSCQKPNLMPYYTVAKAVLGSRPIPTDASDPRRRIPKTELFQCVAQRAQPRRDSQLVDINVFFGKVPDAPPVPIGQQERNRYGALQTSCTYCGECICGCNLHAKNTVDLNYLYVAENRHQASVLPECLVEEIVPVDAVGADDPDGDGSQGYRVKYRELTQNKREAILASRVVVSAGSLGSTELLLRCKRRTLPGISPRLGQQFSGNGDFLAFVVEGFSGNPNYGPTITQRTDYNLFQNFASERAFILEDASYAAFLAWFVEGLRPRWMWFRPVAHLVRRLITSLISGKSPGTIGFAFADLLSKSTSSQSAVLLCMGVDSSNGVMDLDPNGQLRIHWPWRENRRLYDGVLEAGEEFKRLAGAKVFSALPTWDWPLRNNITVHPLGGCALADSPAGGVTSADPVNFGEIFGYKGLYVADGAILPTASGSNPIATICALSERVAEGITNIPPDDEL
jgi:cholesterol oxidase